jgi:hypothetical protein
MNGHRYRRDYTVDGPWEEVVTALTEMGIDVAVTFPGAVVRPRRANGARAEPGPPEPGAGEPPEPDAPDGPPVADERPF